MQYRNRPYKSRPPVNETIQDKEQPVIQPEPANAQRLPVLYGPDAEQVEEVKIPLPSEEPEQAPAPKRYRRKKPIFDILGRPIGFEDLFLIGLILLLLSEEGMEEDFLPAILIYILLT